MSILSDFEDRLSGAVEGLFAGAFRSPVQPAEVAKTLGRAMDDHRSVGVGKVYAPTSFTVALSADDRDQLGEFAPTLAGELATFLIGHAAEQSYDLIERPTVEFVVHDDLRLGRFRVSAAMRATPDTVAPAPAPTPSRATESHPVYGVATVTVAGEHHDIALKGDRVVVGRLAGCEVCLADANISRQHAAFVRIGNEWTVEDLGSTNGTFVNNEPATAALLRNGDVVQIGATKLIYNEPKE